MVTNHTRFSLRTNATNQRRCTPIQDHSPAANSKHVTATDVAMITCMKCQKTLPTSQFAKAQQKKFKKGKTCANDSLVIDMIIELDDDILDVLAGFSDSVS